MIEFNAYVRNPPAPRIFVNNIGGVYRLDGGIIQVTFAQQLRDPNFNTVEQGSLIWPEAIGIYGICCAGCRKKSPEERSAGTSRRSGRTERASPSAPSFVVATQRWNKCPYALVRYV
jgi:hypothetical protein